MLHKFELTDAISRLPEIQFEGRVFRVMAGNFDPTAPSGSGGRWAFPTSADGGCSVLYTSRSRDGAIAEVASYLALSTPRPSRPLYVHALEIATHKTLRLTIDDLKRLGVSEAEYGNRNYFVTQQIGAAVNFLGYDGLIVPSARWNCENVVLFTENHGFHHKLEKAEVEEIDWQAWAKANSLLED